MKYAPFVFAIVVVGMLAGCQTSDDILNTSPDKAKIDPSVEKSPTCRRVEIHGHVTVPGQFNAILEVNGTAEYSIILLPRDPIPPNPQYSLVLGMIVNAELRDVESGEAWQTAGTTYDELPFDDGETLSVTKRYWVTGLDMWLNIAFSVTKNEIQVSAMWLQLPKLIRGDEQN
jgi:hypothetical protein